MNPSRKRRLAGVLAFLAATGAAPSPAPALLPEEENTIAVFEAVAPSVVNITTVTVGRDFLMRPVPAQGSGSGVIIEDDGTIVTNRHVIETSGPVFVTLSDGSRYQAHRVGSNLENDLALLRIEPGDCTLTPIAFADSKAVRVGEKVLAVGNPFGLGQTLTTGVVSSVGRDIRSRGQVLRGLIQTDAAVNPGNSGGALVNSRGELIGVNTLILSPSGGSVGVGFAIPAHQVRKVTSGMATSPWTWLAWILGIYVGWRVLRRLRAR